MKPVWGSQGRVSCSQRVSWAVRKKRWWLGLQWVSFLLPHWASFGGFLPCPAGCSGQRNGRTCAWLCFQGSVITHLFISSTSQVELLSESLDDMWCIPSWETGWRPELWAVHPAGWSLTARCPWLISDSDHDPSWCGLFPVNWGQASSLGPSVAPIFLILPPLGPGLQAGLLQVSAGVGLRDMGRANLPQLELVWTR